MVDPRGMALFAHQVCERLSDLEERLFLLETHFGVETFRDESGNWGIREGVEGEGEREKEDAVND